MPEPAADDATTVLERSGAWPARVAWVALAVISSATLADALDGRSAAVAMTASVLAGLGWTAGLVALLVPRTASLTLARILVPAGLAGAVAAVAAGSETDVADVATLGVAAVATVATLAPWVTDAWVDGSAYGVERRVALRTPVIFALGVAPLTWAVVVLGAVTGPLLLAARAWVPGALALAVGWPVAYAGGRALHQLARRWIVLVPTGLVLHDPLTMPEAQLFPRSEVAHLGPAPGDSDAVDLTAGASGLAVQLDLREPGELLVRTRGRGTSTTTSASVLFTPLRPAHLLAAAAGHRIPTSLTTGSP